MLGWWRQRVTADVRNRIQFPTEVTLARGTRVLLDPPKVIVGTIHSVKKKGGEADVVFLFPDLSDSGMNSYRRYGHPRDSVIRTFYVMTRAREVLYFVRSGVGRSGERMKERPIIFSTPMVRAILDGRKTQTRRVIREARGAKSLYAGEKDGLWVVERFGDAAQSLIRCPYGRVGDRLWARETYELIYWRDENRLVYRADSEVHINRWIPAIHMPRFAARLFLRIEDIRVERLQSITDEDAWAEGVFPEDGDAVAAFADLWDRINGKRGFGWDTNPLVWVVQFQKIGSLS